MELSLLLNGVEYRTTDKYNIREQSGQPAFSSFDVKLEGNPLPLTHTKVEFKDNGTPIFTGYITEVSTPVYSTRFETDIAPIKVISQETIFTRRLVSEVYDNKFTHEIVLDLFDVYLVEEGLTLGTIEIFERLYINLVIPNLRMSDILQELGDEIGAIASISPDGVFDFISKSSFPEITAPTHITGLKLLESGQDLKTIQKISGAKAETSIQTLVSTWILDQQNITLGYQVSEEPTVSINSVQVDVGVQGIDDGNPLKVFLWKYGNNTIVLNANSSTIPDIGDEIGVIFKGFFDVEVNVENESLKDEIAMISGTSGKIESIVIDTSITNVQDGETTANNLLSEKGIREQTVTLTCEDIVKSQLLNSWYLNYPDLNIVGNFVITERTIVDFYDKFRISLKLKNRGFYSRYGTVLNKNTREINNLSIRSDKKIFKNSNFGDTVTWIETLEINENFMKFTCGTSDIMSPLFIDGITPSI